jgi:hypothetical protein
MEELRRKTVGTVPGKGTNTHENGIRVSIVGRENWFAREGVSCAVLRWLKNN